MTEENLDVRADAKTVKTAKKSHKLGKMVMAGVLAMALGGAGALAYFTGMGEKINNFNISSGFDGDKNAIEVIEPNWHEKDAQNMIPLQEVSKDPAVRNNSDMEAWMFAKVLVPVADVVTVGVDGTPLNDGAAVETELYTYDLKADNNWTVKGDTEYETIDGVKYAVHTYVYGEKVAAKVAGEENGPATDAIFEKVRLVNLKDAQDQNGAKQIIVRGMGIQAKGFDTVDAAYSAYINQNASVVVDDDTQN